MLDVPVLDAPVLDAIVLGTTELGTVLGAPTVPEATRALTLGARVPVAERAAAGTGHERKVATRAATPANASRREQRGVPAGDRPSRSGLIARG